MELSVYHLQYLMKASTYLFTADLKLSLKCRFKYLQNICNVTQIFGKESAKGDILFFKIFLPNSRAFLPTFRTNCPCGSHFAQIGSHFAQKTTPNPCSLLNRHPPLSGIYTCTKLPQLSKPTPKHPFSWLELESGQNELQSGQFGPQLGKMFEKWQKNLFMNFRVQCPPHKEEASHACA